MIVLSWNCRGLARPSAVRNLWALVRDLHPDIVFLAETKVKDAKVTRTLSDLGFPNLVSVPPINLAGGLCLGWRNGIEIEVITFNNFLINVLVYSAPPSSPWMFTVVYGPPSWQGKSSFLTQLDTIAKSFSGPWLCMGDFNLITSQADKRGGRPFASSSAGGLKEIIDPNALVDIGFSGNPFTWSNKRGGHANIRERLDRGIANLSWRALFPHASLSYLPAISSDHCPILLNCSGISNSVIRPFKFQAMWTRDVSSSLVVEHAWRSNCRGSSAFRLCQKIKSSRLALSEWKKNHFGVVHSKILALQKAISAIQICESSSANLEVETNLQLELDECWKREEILWKQKSRVQWLKEGDKNTKFFHLSTVICGKRNSIDFLKNEAGQWISDRASIGTCFTNQLKDLFSSSHPDFPDSLDSLLPRLITEDDNMALCSIPDETKIRDVLFRMGSLKAPGPDGMSVLFYKHYWSTIKFDVVNTVRSFFLGGFMLKQLNHTNIALIPKTDSAYVVHHFRPISLCNVIYKLIAKILSNRLQPFLSKLISPVQAAFVPGRSITDNSIMVHEILHSMKKKSGKGGLMAIKIDMEHAYDKMNGLS
ncbi:hypothetical protein L1049_016549 [Liquidambar formosana]|uniref:Reverse transcriptase domain-containing protein n=1 Tax=Liquidambar formosana TaxID=63359 RepID=A0AAP0S017_LIQFO